MNVDEAFGGPHYGPDYFYAAPHDAAYLTHNEAGLLRPGTERYILSVPACALEYLKLLSRGGLDMVLYRQHCYLLYRLHQREPGPSGPWHEVRLKLIETLRVLATKTGSFIEAQGGVLELNDDRLSSYSFGNGSGGIQYALSVAETLAMKVFIEGFAEKFAASDQPADLCGEWYLEISKPQDLDLSREFAGIYDGSAHAQITQCGNDPIWHCHFRGFPPLTNWYSLEGRAYQAVVPMLSRIFCATVTARGQLSD